MTLDLLRRGSTFIDLRIGHPQRAKCGIKGRISPGLPRGIKGLLPSLVLHRRISNYTVSSWGQVPLVIMGLRIIRYLTLTARVKTSQSQNSKALRQGSSLNNTIPRERWWPRISSKLSMSSLPSSPWKTSSRRLGVKLNSNIIRVSVKIIQRLKSLSQGM